MDRYPAPAACAPDRSASGSSARSAANSGGGPGERRTADQTTVADLLDLVLLDYQDHGRQLQVGRIEPWYSALGTWRVDELERADIDDVCRRWRSHGPTWPAGSRTLSDDTTITWPARPRDRVRPLSGASLNRLLASHLSS